MHRAFFRVGAVRLCELVPLFSNRRQSTNLPRFWKDSKSITRPLNSVSNVRSLCCIRLKICADVSLAPGHISKALPERTSCFFLNCQLKCFAFMDQYSPLSISPCLYNRTHPTT